MAAAGFDAGDQHRGVNLRRGSDNENNIGLVNVYRIDGKCFAKPMTASAHVLRVNNLINYQRCANYP